MSQTEPSGQKQFQVTVDEVEVDAAGERVATLVTDDGLLIVVPEALLPEGSRDGDMLAISVTLVRDETERRRQRIIDRQRRLIDRAD